MLSRVERGLTSLSVHTLYKLADALRLPAFALVDDDVEYWAMVLREALPFPVGASSGG